MTDEEIGYLLPSIRYACLCYRFGKLEDFIAAGNQSPHEEHCSCFWDVLGIAPDVCYTSYHEIYETERYYFSYEAMMDYYRLCRVYSKTHRRKLRDNPYMQSAENFVEHVMDLGEYGCYGFRLQTKINHKWASGIVLHVDSGYFNAEFELSEALFEIGAWYKVHAYELRKVLLEERAFWLPALPQHEEELSNEQRKRTGDPD